MYVFARYLLSGKFYFISVHINRLYRRYFIYERSCFRVIPRGIFSEFKHISYYKDDVFARI